MALPQLAYLYRALRHPNYRLFFFGQILSLIGTWLTMIATSWLVYRLARESMPDKAAYILGIVGFASQIPVSLVAPFAGVWIDRHNKHKILKITQTLSMVQSFALAYLALTHQITILQVIFLNLAQGFINAFDMPARQTFVVEMVEDRADLSNAIALNASMVHGARLIGPSIGGFLIYWVGEGGCFLIDGFSFLAVLIALFFIRPRSVPPAEDAPALQQLKEGFAYAANSTPIKALLLLVATASLMFISQNTLMPLIADQVLKGSERTLGFLLGASGLGALFGSLFLASRKNVLGLGKIIRNAGFTVGTAFILVALSRTLPLSLVLLLVCGCSTVLLTASCNMVLQTIVDDDKRGRIMSLFTLAFLGTAPLCSLFTGSLANNLGVSWTFAICGVLCIMSASYFGFRLEAIRDQIRPIYRAKGILPPLPNEPEPPAN